MIVTIKKHDGKWVMELPNGTVIPTPFADTEPRRSVVGYARRTFLKALVRET